MVPPANRRVEFNGSGAPSGMMAQPQSAYGPNRIRASTARPRFGARTRRFEAGFGRSQGWRRTKCRLRRPVGRDEGTREAGGLPGRRLLVLFAKESGLSKVTRPSPKGGRNPFEGRALASCMAKPCQSGERESVSPPADHKKTAAQGLRFFIGSTCWHQTPTRPTVLRHGASWSCRRCLPALCPSR